MANLSDAFGTITVEGIGAEFLEFLKAVQGTDQQAYYKLAEPEDFSNAEPDEHNNVSFTFSTCGRWSYSNNIRGYLNGEWMERNQDDYDRFVESLKKRNGIVHIEYTDSDSSMDWMGTGFATLHLSEDEVSLSEDFSEEPISVAGYMEMNGYDLREAMEILHGEEPADAYEKYIKKCKEENKEPVDVDEWYDEIYEEE